MPQIFTIIAPSVRSMFSEDVLNQLGPELIATTERVYGLEGKEDVTFTAIHAACVIGDADVQIEIRYTVGKGEYEPGVVFKPSRKQMHTLASALTETLKVSTSVRGRSLSIWVIPYEGTVFVFEEVL